MSKTHGTDFEVWSRDEFEDILSDLVTGARANDIHIEGTYEAWPSDGVDLRIDIAEMFEGDRQELQRPNRERRPDDLGAVDVTSRASLVQLLTGLPVEEDECTVFCRDCYAGIRNGDVVTTHCRKLDDRVQWDVTDVYCQDCEVSSIAAPSFGSIDVLVEATVADTMDSSDQSSKQVLNNVRILDYSPPPDGAA
jgi:hypothetical protein